LSLFKQGLEFGFVHADYVFDCAAIRIQRVLVLGLEIGSVSAGLFQLLLTEVTVLPVPVRIRTFDPAKVQAFIVLDFVVSFPLPVREKRCLPAGKWILFIVVCNQYITLSSLGLVLLQEFSQALFFILPVRLRTSLFDQFLAAITDCLASQSLRIRYLIRTVLQ